MDRGNDDNQQSLLGGDVETGSTYSSVKKTLSNGVDVVCNCMCTPCMCCNDLSEERVEALSTFACMCFVVVGIGFVVSMAVTGQFTPHHGGGDNSCTSFDILNAGTGCYDTSWTDGTLEDWQGNPTTQLCSEAFITPGEGNNFVDVSFDYAPEAGDYAGSLNIQCTQADDACVIQSVSNGYTGSLEKTGDCQWALKSQAAFFEKNARIFANAQLPKPSEGYRVKA